MDWLIVTDLDGTLLDDRYQIAGAGAAIDTLATAYPEARIALASSKTPAEMIELSRRCGCDPVLIFENGSGMAWRGSALCRRGDSRIDDFEVECFGTSYRQVLQTLQTLRRKQGYRFRGFADMTPGEISSRTGLCPEEAEQARQRVGSEPLVWEGSEAELAAFRDDLDGHGLRLVRGGRFLHVGSHMNKGRAVARLWRELRFEFGIHAVTVACGDAPNDLEMMEWADHAIVFPAPEGGYLEPDNPNTRLAPVAGPSAWLDALTGLLGNYHRDTGQGAMAT